LAFNQSHPGLPSLAIAPWVGTISTKGSVGHPLGKKRRVMRNRPLPEMLAYWPSWLKALVAMRPAIRLTCVYASFTGFTLAILKGLRKGLSSRATDLVQAHILLLLSRICGIRMLPAFSQTHAQKPAFKSGALRHLGSCMRESLPRQDV